MQVKRINALTGQITVVSEVETPDLIVPERIRGEYQERVQNFIDEKAQERGYSNGVSCVSYYSSTVPQWQAEAVAFSAWRDAVWVYVLGTLDEVQNGTIERPTLQQFRQNLPKMVWP
jgi:hypothetical protein